MPVEGAVCIALEDGLPVFRASSAVQRRIETLLSQQQNARLSETEEQELDCYEEIDDYLSLVNRTMRNFFVEQLLENH